MPGTAAVLILVCSAITILFSFTAANPLLGLVHPNCFYASTECPNEHVSFWLYSNETRDSPLLLDPLNLRRSDFRPRRPVKIVIHGYTGHRDFSPNAELRDVLLHHEDVYVISPDFGPLVRQPCYFYGVSNLPVASKCLAHLINDLVDRRIVANEDIHLIGFSLGAQVAGQTANYVNRKLKRITGLDPAKPMFITVSADRKLDPTDAEFVDVIHTDVLGRGMLRAMGHADFYPNIGPYQPGCQQDINPGSCNHRRAPEFYAESIVSREGFWGSACPSWLHFIFGLCYGASHDVEMGYFVDERINGSFFLQTAAQSPFALGSDAFTKQSNIDHTNNLQYYNINEIDDEYFEPQLRSAFKEWSEDEIFETRVNEILNEK